MVSETPARIWLLNLDVGSLCLYDLSGTTLVDLGLAKGLANSGHKALEGPPVELLRGYARLFEPRVRASEVLCACGLLFKPKAYNDGRRCIICRKFNGPAIRLLVQGSICILSFEVSPM